MCKKKVTESPRTRHWKQTFPLGGAVLKISLQSKTDMYSPWQSGFHILVWMFVRSQAVFLHTQSQTAPTFPGDKEDVVMILAIHLPVIFGGGMALRGGKKVREDWQKEEGRKREGKGKCPSLNTTLQKFNNGNKQILNYWSYNQFLISSPIRFLEAFSLDNRKMKFKKQSQNKFW